MSRVEGSELGSELVSLLDGNDLHGKVGETILLLTVSETPGEVRMALWKGTRTGDNLRRTSQGTLALVHGGAGHYVELQVTDSGRLEAGPMTLDYFSCKVARVLTDVVGYATLTSGIRFDLPRQDEVVSRWERTVEAMRAL